MFYLTILVPADSAKPTKHFLIVQGGLRKLAAPKTKLWKCLLVEHQDIEEFFEAMVEIYSQHPVVAVRGVPRKDLDTKNPVYRRRAYFHDEPTTFLCIDVDGVSVPNRYSAYGVAAVAWLIRNHLPPEFRDVTVVACFSSSAGIIDPTTSQPVKPGLCVHLFFELDTPLTSPQAKAWLKDYPVDLALYNPVQIHYLSDPVIGEGVKCLVKKRHHLIEGRSKTVPVPATIRTAVPNVRRATARRVAASHIEQSSDWQNPVGGLPAPEYLFACDFIRWFVEEPSVGTGRYPVARAFATNTYRTSGNAEQLVLDGLNANRPEGYTHAGAILASLPESRPISCRVIFERFQCPKFNPNTKSCARDTDVISPYGLGLKLHKESEK